MTLVKDESVLHAELETSRAHTIGWGKLESRRLLGKEGLRRLVCLEKGSLGKRWAMKLESFSGKSCSVQLMERGLDLQGKREHTPLTPCSLSPVKSPPETSSQTGRSRRRWCGRKKREGS